VGLEAFSLLLLKEPCDNACHKEFSNRQSAADSMKSREMQHNVPGDFHRFRLHQLCAIVRHIAAQNPANIDQ